MGTAGQAISNSNEIEARLLLPNAPVTAACYGRSGVGTWNRERISRTPSVRETIDVRSLVATTSRSVLLELDQN